MLLFIFLKKKAMSQRYPTTFFKFLLDLKQTYSQLITSFFNETMKNSNNEFPLTSCKTKKRTFIIIVD